MEFPDGATPLDPDEMEGLRFKHITTRAELDHLEQANVQSGIEWMRRSNRTDLLTEKYVCDLHKQLFGEVWQWAGKFRKTEKNIGIDPLHIAVELHKLLHDMQYWHKQNSYSAYEACIRFHHRLVSIHPFANGNGRHARIMTDAILLKIYQLPLLDWAGGHNLQSMNVRRVEYINALRAADKGSYQLLFNFAGIN